MITNKGLNHDARIQYSVPAVHTMASDANIPLLLAANHQVELISISIYMAAATTDTCTIEIGNVSDPNAYAEIPIAGPQAIDTVVTLEQGGTNDWILNLVPKNTLIMMHMQATVTTGSFYCSLGYGNVDEDTKKVTARQVGA